MPGQITLVSGNEEFQKYVGNMMELVNFSGETLQGLLIDNDGELQIATVKGENYPLISSKIRSYKVIAGGKGRTTTPKSKRAYPKDKDEELEETVENLKTAQQAVREEMGSELLKQRDQLKFRGEESAFLQSKVFSLESEIKGMASTLQQLVGMLGAQGGNTVQAAPYAFKETRISEATIRDYRAWPKMLLECSYLHIRTRLREEFSSVLSAKSKHTAREGELALDRLERIASYLQEQKGLIDEPQFRFFSTEMKATLERLMVLQFGVEEGVGRTEALDRELATTAKLPDYMVPIAEKARKEKIPETKDTSNGWGTPIRISPSATAAWGGRPEGKGQKGFRMQKGWKGSK